MKRLRIAVVVGFGMLMPFQTLGSETIKIGYLNHKPHQYLSGTVTKPGGAAVTFFEAVAVKMGYEVEWVGPLPFIRLLDYLQDGVLDGGVAFVKDNLPGSEDFLYYSDKPCHLAQSIFVVSKENPLQQISSIHDVEGYRVGWLTGIAPSQFVRDNAAHLQMDYITPGDTMWEQSVKKLLLGRIDALHELDAYTLPFAAAEMHLLAQLKVLPLPEPPVPAYTVFAKQSPKGKLLVEKYNAVLADMAFTPEDYVKLLQQEFDALSK